jgi:hypothetical protein
MKEKETTLQAKSLCDIAGRRKSMMTFHAEVEAQMAKCKAEGRCISCERVFPEPEKEFKILRNPITGETKQSHLCRECLKIAVDRFKRVIKEGGSKCI